MAQGGVEALGVKWAILVDAGFSRLQLGWSRVHSGVVQEAVGKCALVACWARWACLPGWQSEMVP